MIQNDLSILMEFMAGGNLKNFLARTPGQGQNKEFTLNFTEGIGSAIGHLHSLNLMHRDVKPENIFVRNMNSPTPTARSGLLQFLVNPFAHKTNHSNFPCCLARNISITQYEELAFSWLTQMNDDCTSNSYYSTYTLLFKNDWDNTFFS